MRGLTAKRWFHFTWTSKQLFRSPCHPESGHTAERTPLGGENAVEDSSIVNLKQKHDAKTGLQTVSILKTLN